MSVVTLWVTGYLSGGKIATLSSDFAYIPLTVLLTITALFQVFQAHKNHKNVGMWIGFTVFAFSYNIAQHIWSLNELILDQKPFPSLADVAFVISTISLITFFMLVIRSEKQAISKWMYVISIPAGCCVIALSSYFFISSNTETTLDQILLVTYPIMDGIALIPASIGILMYFKGKVDFSTYLIGVAVIPLTVGDILFQITTISNTYYSGSITDLFYYIQITLMIFGVYIKSNAKIRTNRSVSQT